MEYSLLPLFKSNNDKHMIITIMTIRDKHFFLYRTYYISGCLGYNLILLGVVWTHLHNSSKLNLCLHFLIILAAAFTSALIIFPFCVSYNPRFVLLPLNSYFASSSSFSSSFSWYSGSISSSRKLLWLVYDSSCIIRFISCIWHRVFSFCLNCLNAMCENIWFCFFPILLLNWKFLLYPSTIVPTLCSLHFFYDETYCLVEEVVLYVFEFLVYFLEPIGCFTSLFIKN